MRPTILFLRPFWDADITARQLKALHGVTRRLGTLLAIRNGPERAMLRLASDENPWARRWALLGRLFDWLRPPLDLQLIEATDETWQEHVIQLIQTADVVNSPPRSPARL